MAPSPRKAATSPNEKEIIELDKETEIVDLDPEVILDEDEIPYLGDVMTEEQFERWIAQQQQQIQPKILKQSRTRTSCARNGPVVPPLVILDTYQHCGQLLRPGANVELRDGDFLRISYIIQNISTDEVLLRGRLFRRLTFMNGTLEKKINEVCWILHIDEDDDRPSEIQCLEEIKVDEVIKRRGLKLTNQDFPCLSWRDESNGFTETNDTIRNDRVLVCRWKYICLHANAVARKNNVHTQKALIRLRNHESDRGCGVDDMVLRRKWRGQSDELLAPSSPTTSMSTLGKNEDTAIIDLTDNGETEPAGLQSMENCITVCSNSLSGTGDLAFDQARSEQHEKRIPVQRYTFADAFCGCGGTSRGATMAGLHVKWAFDFAEAMCKSYQKNFATAQVYWTSADQFVVLRIADVVVDILHISPPCNYYSPAHTTEGRDDEQNTAASFVITELLKMALPRIVTLENTFGLEKGHILYLHAVLQQFTVLGFSVAWKIIKVADYGVPQNRQRLVIIAAWYVDVENSLALELA